MNENSTDIQNKLELEDEERSKEILAKLKLEDEVIASIVTRHFPDAQLGKVIGRGATGCVFDGNDRVYKVLFNTLKGHFDSEENLPLLTRELKEIATKEISFYKNIDLKDITPSLLAPVVITEKYILFATEKIEQHTQFFKLPVAFKKALSKKIRNKLIKAKISPRFDTEIVWNKEKKQTIILDLASLTHHPNLTDTEVTELVDKELEKLFTL